MLRPIDNPNEGVYARKQLHSKSRLIKFSHLRRFQVALDLVAPLAAGKRVLDYGCGDGTFIYSLLAAGCAPLEVTGADISQSLMEDCQRRFPERPDLRFVHISELPSLATETKFDVVTCMEVLEHAIDPEAVLDEMHSLLSDSGRLIISVPVEIGPVLLVKQAVRIAAGRRGIGDYQWTSRYTLPEYWKSLFAGSASHIARPIYTPPDSHPSHCHKGFNWRHLKQQIAARFRIERVFGSPFPSLPPLIGSQVWFIARKT